MNKYEQLIEHIINDNEQAARELFHQIVVEKSRDIYESLIDEEQVEEHIGGNPSQEFVNDVTQDVQHDEQGIGEDDEEGAEFDLDSSDEEGEAHGDFPADDNGEEGEEDLETKVMDLETELDQLKAEFDRLLSGEEAEEHDHPGIHDVGGDDAGTDMGPEMDEEMGVMETDEQVEEGANPFAKSGKSGKSGSAKSGVSGKSGSAASGKSGKSGSGKMESRTYQKDQVEVMKEYVDKIKDFYKGDNSEGSEVGNGGSVAVNTKSDVAGKNDMGGSTANIAKGGAEQNPDGKQYKKPSNEYSKKEGTLPHAGQFQNVPGAKAKQEATGTEYSKEHGAEGETTDGKVPVTSKSVVGGKVR
jgi:hypothetical protein